MKLYNCPYKGDMCFLYGNCEECAFYKSMEKNRNYRKTIKNLKKENEELQKQVDELTAFKNEAISMSLYGKGRKDGGEVAAKDTAKEIFTDIDNAFSLYYPHGQIPYSVFQDVIKQLAKKKCVEVE